MSTAGGRCSLLNAGESPAGSALTDERILVVEQPGSWGRDAVTDSNLDPRIIADAARDCRVMLARHPDCTRPQDVRRWWTLQVIGSSVVAAKGSHPWDSPLGADVWTPPETARDDPAAAAEPTVFLCTNGRRDACCAEFGRALLRQFAGAPRLWEISHLGGHRFAPTGLMLPLGMMLGRLDAPAVSAALAGSLPAPQHLRGRVGRSPQRQAAELAVAARTSADIGTFASTQTAEDVVEVAHPAAPDDPYDWYQVRLVQQHGPARPASCGAERQPSEWWAEAGG